MASSHVIGTPCCSNMIFFQRPVRSDRLKVCLCDMIMFQSSRSVLRISGVQTSALAALTVFTEMPAIISSVQFFISGGNSRLNSIHSALLSQLHIHICLDHVAKFMCTKQPPVLNPDFKTRTPLFSSSRMETQLFQCSW